MSGQDYFGAAHVSFVLAARFYRNHWKYRRHPRAYAGILMDAAHLSQTLYLVAAELGLGAYMTIAINGRDIEERLGLDGVEAGADRRLWLWAARGAFVAAGAAVQVRTARTSAA